MLNAAAANYQAKDNVIPFNFKGTCNLLVQGGHQAVRTYPSKSRTRTPHSTFEPTAWVYESHYDPNPIGVLFSPTKSLVFFIPFDIAGDLAFEETSYLELLHDEIVPVLRSGKSILASRLGNKTEVSSPSLLRWIERIACTKRSI